MRRNTTMVTVLMIMFVPALSQELPERTDLVINVSGAPVRLSHTERTLSTHNLLDKKVTSYRLGCGKTASKGIKVVYKFPIQTIPIAPSAEISSASFHLLPSELRACQQRHAKLVAISATSEDGNVWNLKRDDKAVH